MNTPSILTIHTDGAARGNPGPAAYAYVIARDGAAPIEECGCLGTMTNNQAEYTALVRALEHAARLGHGHALVIHSDSELMVKQMRGEYRVKNEDLRDLYQQASRLSRQFAAVTYRHVRREQNRRADELCNEALDGKRGESRPAPEPPADARSEALAYLRQVRTAWGAGAPVPTEEDVWERLRGLIGNTAPPRTPRSRK
jgi:ribonuclease HI